MPSTRGSFARAAGAQGATLSREQPVRGGEEGAAERVSAGPAPRSPCQRLPGSLRRVLASLRASPRAGSAPFRPGIPARPRSWRGPTGWRWARDPEQLQGREVE